MRHSKDMRWTGDMFDVAIRLSKEDLWDRWQRGESLKAIERMFGKPLSSIDFQVARTAAFVLRHGGVRDWH